MNIYDYSVLDGNEKQVSLGDYKGKVLLIINSATECGFTPQYEDIQDIYEKYNAEGFEVLDFPCNQFGNQAPGTSEEIHLFCSQRFGISFPTFEKIDVNGPNEAPLFKYLKSEKGFKGFDENHPITPALVDILEKAVPDYKETSDIKWNFTKFLVDREGNVIQRFEPTEDMGVVDDKIKELI